MNKLDTLFKHKNWFTNYNEITNKYEPYLSKRLALQYFASSEDFIYNGKTFALAKRNKEYSERYNFGHDTISNFMTYNEMKAYLMGMQELIRISTINK